MEPAVNASHLGKIIRDKTILRDISVAAAPGDIVGILGKNGAGKTTTLDILLGFSPATAGSSGERQRQFSCRRRSRGALVSSRSRTSCSINSLELQQLARSRSSCRVVGIAP